MDGSILNRKKVAIFGVKYFPARGGTSRVVEDLLLELKDRYEITIYCYRHKDARNHIPGIKVVEFKEKPFGGLGVFIYYFLCCLHILFKGKYDLIHAHKTDCAFFLPFLSLKYPTIITSHALPYLNDKWSAVGKTYFRIVEWVYMRSKAYPTSISKTQKGYYEDRYKRAVKYIPNGVKPESDWNVYAADEILAKHGVDGPFLLFAARRVIPLKGAHHLIEALHKIDYKGTLVIAGDIGQMLSYTRRLKEAAGNLRVVFIGYVADKPTLMGLIDRASFFVFPSEIEGMSMMLLEVCSVGTPVIGSDIPQNKAVLTESEILFFESKNADDLAEKLLFAHENGTIMQEKADRARYVVTTEYAIDNVANEYAELYEDRVSGTALRSGNIQVSPH